MKDLATFIVSLFQDLKLPLRWLAMLAILLFAILGLWGYESLTGHLFYSQLEKKTALLKELQLIANDGIAQKPELYPIYLSAVAEVGKHETFNLSNFNIPSINIGDPVVMGKAISGASIWLLVLLVGLPPNIRKEGKLTFVVVATTIAIVALGLFFAWIGTLIPTLLNPWINFIGFPLAQFAIVYLLFGRRKTKT